VDNLTLNIEQNTSAENTEHPFIPSAEKSSFAVMIIPLLVAAFFFAGFTQLRSNEKDLAASVIQDSGFSNKYPNINFLALLTGDEFSENLRDTIYTDKDKYLEMRIDKQMVYVHYKDGRVKPYQVSTGNKYLSKGIESRPGLFAIFIKEELHLSSQFNDAKMYYYMPFNMGIGFHGLAGTGYYGNLGVRPSSHGCIRMRTAEAKQLFNECEIGTLVLVLRGETARTVSFAPFGFHNEREYSKDEYMNLMAYNLNTIYEGKYFTNPPKRFVIDPAIIPRIGYSIGNTENIPEKQQIPVVMVRYHENPDVSSVPVAKPVAEKLSDELAENFSIEEDTSTENTAIETNPDLVKKLVYNPRGILPYFPPNK
jgi:hypothetical protein